MNILTSRVLFSNQYFEKTSDNAPENPDSNSGTECLNIFERLQYKILEL